MKKKNLFTFVCLILLTLGISVTLTACSNDGDSQMYSGELDPAPTFQESVKNYDNPVIVENVEATIRLDPSLTFGNPHSGGSWFLEDNEGVRYYANNILPNPNYRSDWLRYDVFNYPSLKGADEGSKVVFSGKVYEYNDLFFSVWDGYIDPVIYKYVVEVETIEQIK